MFGNTITPQDIIVVVRQGQREGFVAGVACSAGFYAFVKLAGPNVKEFFGNRVNLKTRNQDK